MAAAEPSPSEFQPYRKVQGKADADLRAILELTAKQIQKRIAALPVGVGGQVRGAQLRLTLAAIRKMQRAMWTGRIGPLVERGWKDAEDAAESAIEAMTRVAYAALPEAAAESLVRSLKATAESGLKSDAARKKRELSERVYKLAALHDGKVEDQIRAGLIAGLSAKELAADVYQYVSPNTKGGASYAAMRLARTEINNAFHERQIQGATRPGVKAVKWNLSGSHTVPDECNEYAAHKPYEPTKVPDKPHPHCFCYLTYVTMSSDDFKTALANGDFDDEIERRTRENMARLGQRVGTIDPTPTPESAKTNGREVPKNDDIRKAVESGEESSEKLSGGVSAITSKVKYKNGKVGVKKVVEDSSAKHQQDAEELIPMLGRMMGLRAAQVTRVDEKTTVQEFLTGGQLATSIPHILNPGTPQAKILNHAGRVKPYVESDSGWLMGVLDQVTGNQDRHDGNWMIDEEKKEVVGIIDHGLGYILRDFRQKRPTRLGLDEPYIFRTKHATKFAKPNGDQSNIDFHPEDLDAIAEMLTALKPEYEKRNRLDWWEFSMKQVNALRPFAKGKKRRIK